MKTAVLTVDLAFGDTGKGATVDALCRKLKAGLVVRYSGGWQAGHNVQVGDKRHTFSQFGSGTLAGASTFLDRHVIIEPIAIHKEAEELEKHHNVSSPLHDLFIHPQCLISTAYHQITNQLKELNRTKRHGSCGKGIGDTRQHWLQYGQDAIVAADLRTKATLRDKIELLHQRTMILMTEWHIKGDFITKFPILNLSPKALTDELFEAGRFLQITDCIPRSDITIFEASQGVLLDEWVGFHPHTTWSTVTLVHALDLMNDLNINEIIKLGITRSYMTRHGEGPFPTYDADFTNRLADPGNPQNSWQGSMRCGHLDFNLLKYAILNCGAKLDGLVLNHLDQVNYNGKCCHIYEAPTMFASDMRDLFANLQKPVTFPDLQRQKNIGLTLEKVDPIYTQIDGSAGMVNHCESHLKLPVLISGYGPTAEDREFKVNLWAV